MSPSRPGDVIVEEPCERCGWRLVLVDLLAAAKTMAGMDPTEGQPGPGPEWCEVHRRDNPDGSVHLGLQQHTPDRCTRRRNGDPEPYEFDDEDPDDDEDYW